MSGDVVKCQQCGGAVHICERPDSTCRFYVRAREFFSSGPRTGAPDCDVFDLATLLRETEDEAWRRLSEARTKGLEAFQRENEVLRSNSDHLSSENASLARQVESMAMRIESLADELAKPEDVRLRDVLDALDGRAVILDDLGAHVGRLLDEMDEWIARAEEAEKELARVRAALLALPRYTACSSPTVGVPPLMVAELREDPDGRAVLFADVLAALEGS